MLQVENVLYLGELYSTTVSDTGGNMERPITGIM